MAQSGDGSIEKTKRTNMNRGVLPLFSVLRVELRHVADELCFREDLGDLLDKQRELGGEVRLGLRPVGKHQELLANQILKGALQPPSLLDGPGSPALLVPDFMSCHMGQC